MPVLVVFQKMALLALSPPPRPASALNNNLLTNSLPLAIYVPESSGIFINRASSREVSHL